MEPLLVSPYRKDTMLRIAAVGDLHYGLKKRKRYQKDFSHLKQEADIFLVAGDITQTGEPDEARLFAEDIQKTGVPTVVVLGNHDYNLDKETEISRVLTGHGITVLEGSCYALRIGNTRVGIAGIKGFVGGFLGTELYEFGEKEMRIFAAQARQQAARLRECLDDLVADYKFVLLHYSPIEATVHGEHLSLHPFMGSYHFAQAIDQFGKTVIQGVFHGHAHAGTEKGETEKGTPVWNVAQPVIKQTYKVYTF